ncbi:hypothetical protein [Reticulibacter mediterranei]|uniref:hypothetical protein n=1 Tax=Reticulibacter mediterranei TaxID=2778369 RepID=UPI001C68EB08|nr:hypothetical protein [Reticulibacter mediterranei]
MNCRPHPSRNELRFHPFLTIMGNEEQRRLIARSGRDGNSLRPIPSFPSLFYNGLMAHR